MLFSLIQPNPQETENSARPNQLHGPNQWPTLSSDNCVTSYWFLVVLLMTTMLLQVFLMSALWSTTRTLKPGRNTDLNVYCSNQRHRRCRKVSPRMCARAITDGACGRRFSSIRRQGCLSYVIVATNRPCLLRVNAHRLMRCCLIRLFCILFAAKNIDVSLVKFPCVKQLLAEIQSFVCTCCVIDIPRSCCDCHRTVDVAHSYLVQLSTVLTVGLDICLCVRPLAFAGLTLKLKLAVFEYD